jgi:methionyl-tRNA synthetase
MPPTPNGCLHIGHAAGPYLRADALARALRREGETVLVASGSDAYENWVLMEARKNKEPPRRTCERNHELIARDFANLNIEFDLWINPIDADHAEGYARLHEQLVADLVERGRAFLMSERVPVSAASGEYIIGVWIAGDCPNCGEAVAGNSCVKCGASFQPSEIRNARSRLDHGELRWTDKRSWFVDPGSPQTILENLKRSGVAKEFLQIAESHIARAGTRIRISQPGAWGIKSRLVDPDCVLTNTFYGFSLYCADAAAKSVGELRGYLEGGAKTKVVTLFGKDNAGIGLIAPQAISMSSGKYRSFDHIVVNHLLHFEGSKCSTSRRHGIWVSELIENTSVSGDELRYYLAHAPLEIEPASLYLAGLISVVNELRSWRSGRLVQACESVSSVPDDGVSAAARDAVVRQSLELRCDHLHLARATSILKEWMFDRALDLTNSRQARSWLEGIALLAEPIMPSLALDVWSVLGMSGRPAVEHIGCSTAVRDWQPSTFQELSAAEVERYAYISAEN